MVLDARSAPEAGPDFLKSCLAASDPLQERRARNLKRRALVISVLFQLTVLIAIVLYPLLGKGERLDVKYWTPVVPYSHSGSRRPDRPVPTHPLSNRPICSFCAPTHIPPTISLQSSPSTAPEPDAPDGPDIDGLPSGPSVPGALPASEHQPAPAVPPEQPKKICVHIGTIEPALLTRRVDPLYPALPKQLGREGRVELHAIIATDGSVQSLEVISGDPLFYQSALAAVREWRYRATILNGQPVEVDTHITVLYSLHHN
jgi:protein TonB